MGIELEPSATRVVDPLGADRESLIDAVSVLLDGESVPPETLHPWRYMAVKPSRRKRSFAWVFADMCVTSSRSLLC
jgi:hypothetical protein